MSISIYFPKNPNKIVRIADIFKDTNISEDNQKDQGTNELTRHNKCNIYSFGKNHVWAFLSLISVFSVNSKEALY